MRRMKLTFSPREKQINRLIKLGWKQREIADRLGITAKTVNNWRERIKLKRGADWFTKPS